MSETQNATAARGRYVQYGCGLCAPKAWTNFDASPRLRFERLPGVGQLAAMTGRRLFPENVAFGDIRSGLPLADGSVDGIYASHVLEHLSRNDVVMALANTYKLLRSGGVFRMIVPDLGWRTERYVRDRANGNAATADDLIKALNIGEMDRAKGANALLRSTFGHSGHLWMYDEALMSALLHQAGFIDIKRCTFGDSGNPMFDTVEDRGRFFDDGNPELAMQARKA
jgi:SAM-dependent methyltransferase